MKEIYNKVLEAVAIDPRLDTGIFDVSNNDHLSIFREYLVKEGISEDAAIAASNKLAEAGRFPERQCYNKDGLLVTFPSPEHKQRAIARGTHFEKNPKTAQVNIFGAEPQPTAATTGSQPAPVTPTAPTSVTTPVQKTDATPVNADNRTPEERQADASAVEKMLKTENKSYTLSEAISFGFYSKNNIWYNSEGEKVGRLWYVVDRKQQIILPC